MKKRFWIGYILLLAASFASAQDIKSTPASDALVRAAKEYTDTQKALNDLAQQARSALQDSQKKASAAIEAADKQLWDDLKADKKYKDRVASLDAMHKQLNDAGSKAQQDFQQKAAPLQQVVNTDKALADGLVPIVRKENNLPDSDTFDYATQKWTIAPAKDAKPVEAKK